MVANESTVRIFLGRKGSGHGVYCHYDADRLLDLGGPPLRCVKVAEESPSGKWVESGHYLGAFSDEERQVISDALAARIDEALRDAGRIVTTADGYDAAENKSRTARVLWDGSSYVVQVTYHSRWEDEPPIETKVLPVGHKSIEAAKEAAWDACQTRWGDPYVTR